MTPETSTKPFSSVYSAINYYLLKKPGRIKQLDVEQDVKKRGDLGNADIYPYLMLSMDKALRAIVAKHGERCRDIFLDYYLGPEPDWNAIKLDARRDPTMRKALDRGRGMLAQNLLEWKKCSGRDLVEKYIAPKHGVGRSTVYDEIRKAVRVIEQQLIDDSLLVDREAEDELARERYNAEQAMQAKPGTLPDGNRYQEISRTVREVKPEELL